MYGERLADIDELILRCRNEQARIYISEAVSCYRVGAFRSCIVATWVAIIFDFLHKLRELELTGDGRAKQKLVDFEKIHKDGNLKAALEFERDVLKMAKEEFELISDQEFADLERLQTDRNRCAHPSMNSSEDTYQPSAELARYHLRSAVTHFLQHPPVQGKSALKRLTNDISSQYFPITTEDAIKSFQLGPLGRPRDVLVRNFVIILLKKILSGDLDETGRTRHIIALEAIRHMHRSVAESTLEEMLNGLLQSLQDNKILSALQLLVDLPDTWQYLKVDVTSKLINYVRNIPTDDFARGVDYALDLSALRDIVVDKIKDFSDDELSRAIKNRPRPEFIDRALQLYCGSSYWGIANSRTSLITNLINILEDDHIEQIFKTQRSSKAIQDSYNFKYIIYALEDSGRMSREEIHQMRDKIDQEGNQD